MYQTTDTRLSGVFTSTVQTLEDRMHMGVDTEEDVYGHARVAS